MHTTQFFASILGISCSKDAFFSLPFPMPSTSRGGLLAKAFSAGRNDSGVIPAAAAVFLTEAKKEEGELPGIGVSAHVKRPPSGFN